jgi:5'-methylthioadenosine phosphorylase
MATTFACIAGEEIHRQWVAGRIEGESIGPQETPFGNSSEIFLMRCDGTTFYLLPRYGQGLAKTAPYAVNYRANMYALKDLGTDCVLAWGAGGAITHSMAVGDLLVLEDVIDRTYRRDKTFFDNSPLGYLRQFPVFCPSLRRAICEVLGGMDLHHRNKTIAAVAEGPRLETPAEVRMLGTVGAEVITHVFVPEVFLARELQMCYAAICYVVNYAETGSGHRPFLAGNLFESSGELSDKRKLSRVLKTLCDVIRNVAESLEGQEDPCTCSEAMDKVVGQFGLDDDWRSWLAAAGGACPTEVSGKGMGNSA